MVALGVLSPLHGAFLIGYLVMAVVKVFALIDACLHPDRAYRLMDKQSKQFWLIVLGLTVLTNFFGFLTFIGLVAALVYLLDVRPAVRGVSGKGGGQSQGPYGPW